MSSVKVFFAKEFDPWLNLATEDWLYHDMDPNQNVLFLWRNSPTVVIGRYQNPWQECNLEQMENDGVKLARRQSGGGAVYHDLGNTNFTFMSSRAEYSKERNNSIIIGALRNLGIEATASGRNDLIVDERKFSGSAFKLSKERAFHHGTMLINADMTRLGEYLTPDKDKLKAKGIKSVKSRVTNLVEYKPDITHEELTAQIVEEFFKTYGERCEIEELSYDTITEIPHLTSYYDKMRDWDWRFGKTPEFEYEISHRFDWGKMSFHFDTKHGKIEEVHIFSDSLVPDMVKAMMEALHGIRFNSQDIHSSLNAVSEKMQEHADKIAECSHFLIEGISSLS